MALETEIDFERMKYLSVWEKPEYRVHSPGLRLFDISMRHFNPQPGETLVDFGCGSAQATQKFAEAGLTVTGVDIARNAPTSKKGFKFVAANLWTLGRDFPVFDYGYCTDVMEHIPPEYINSTLWHISFHVRKMVIFQIAMFDSQLDEHILHLTVKPRHWWIEKLRRRFILLSVDEEEPNRLYIVAIPKPYTALCIGGANCVWDDIHEAYEMFHDFDEIVACNDIGTRLPRLDRWVTLHPEKLGDWQKERRLSGFKTPWDIVTTETYPDAIAFPLVHRSVDYRWPGMNASGSSGLYAVKIALEAGAQAVVLAGMPLTDDGKHFIRDARWTERDSFVDAWQIAKPKIEHRVRSFSGWTKQFLGEPTQDWLVQFSGQPVADEMGGALKEIDYDG